MLERARCEINKRAGEIIRSSSIYETEPWGFDDQTSFLNQVLIIDTFLEPHELLDILLRIESELGRKRKSDEYESRLIDIDILFYDNLKINERDLIIPHPRIEERMFVLKPLMEIAPGMIHPVTGLSIKHLYEKCQDKLSVRLFNN